MVAMYQLFNMKRLLFLFLLLPLAGMAQLWQNLPQYGYYTERFNPTLILRLPTDTTNNKLGISRIGTVLYVGNGTYWTSQSGGSGTTVVSDSAWMKTGNAGTNPATDFIGTTDSIDFVVKVNGDENTRITPLGKVDIIDAAGKRQLTFDPSNMYWALGDWAGDFGNATSIHIADSTGEVRIDGFITLQELKNDDPSLAVNDFYPVFYNDNSQAITAGSGVDSIWRPSADSIRFRVRSSIVGKGGTFGIYAPTATGGISGLTTNELVYGNSATTIASLPVATYPSLTELSYVKGVTSGIQAQINALPTASSTTTFTNKRITKRVTTTASSATPTPDGDASDMFTVTALAAGAVFAAPTGTPTDGQLLLIRIKDNGTARSLGWNAIYRASTDFALPTTTVISKTMYVQFVYNSADSKWDCTGLTQGF